jgi:hypothetical protein
MAMAKEDYLARLETALQDTAEKLQPDDKDRLLSQAVLIYAKDRPRKIIHELTGNGTSYDFAMPSSWIEGFSSIISKIEYPADDYQNPVHIEDDEWVFFQKLVSGVTTKYIRFTTFTPASSKKARFLYTLPHTLNDTTNTITDNDIEAVIALTAALCFWALAAKFAQTTDPTIDADVIDYQRKSDLYTTLAKEKLAIYNSLMGLGAEAKGAAAATAGVEIKDLDILFPWGEDYLTHPIRER